MKQNKRISFARLLCLTLAMMLVVSVALCGCGKKKEESGKPESYTGILLGNGNGKLEAQDMAVGASNLYGQMLNFLANANSSNAGGTGVEMNMSITMGEDLKDMISMMLAMTGMEADMDWLNKLEMNYVTAYQGNLMQQLVTAKLNGKNVISGDMVVDMVNGMMYLGYPGLSDKYLGMGMDAATGESMNDSLEEMQAMLEQMAKYADQMPSEQEVNAVLERYIDVIVEAMGDPAVSNETLKYGGVSQKVTAKTYAIHTSDALNVALAVLQAAQNDAQLEALLDDCSTALNNAASEDMAEWENVDLYAMLQAALPEAIEEIQEELEEAAEDDLLGMELVLYTDGDALVGLRYIQHSYVGSEDVSDNHDVQMPYGAVSQAEYKDYTYGFTCYTLHSGEKSAFVLEVGSDIDGYAGIAGTGTEKNGKLNGEYSVFMEEEELLSFELINFSMDALRQGAIVGTVRISLPEDLMDEMGLSAFVYEPVVELVLNIQGNYASVGVNLLDDDDLYIGLSFSFKLVDNVQIEVPKDYIEGSEATIMDWFYTLDLDKALDNLEDAGVPGSWLDTLEGMLQMAG